MCVRLLACCAALSLLACSLDGESTGGRVGDQSPVNALDGATADASGAAPAIDASRASDAASGRADGAVGPGNPDAALHADGSLPTQGDASHDAGLDADGAVPPACGVEGTYALRIDYDVSWDSTVYTDQYGDDYPVFAAGAGSFTLLAHLTMRTGTSGLEAVLGACGTSMPDFMGGSAGYTQELYNAYVPGTSWNAPTMPTWTVPVHASCAEAGCTLALDPLVAVLGGELSSADPSGATVETIDQDGDGRDAITYISRGPPEVNGDDAPYSYITLGSNARARKLDLLVAMSAVLDGAYSSCDELHGKALKPNVEQHAVGCTGVVTDTVKEIECVPATVKFLEATLPDWTASAATFRAVRVPENSCNTVRAAHKP